MGFAKPHADGVLGWVFETFLGFDQPFNLVPSLHITLGVILAAHFARHSRGFVRAALLGWFGLVMLSTVLTHQHHLADMAGGFLLGVLCFYLVREQATATARTGNLRIAAYYGAGTAALVAFAWLAWPLGGVLLWPAFGTAAMTAAYLGVGAAVYGKHNGRLPRSTRLLLAPILAGHHLSLVYYRRQCRSWDAIAPGVRIGRRLNEAEAATAIADGVTAVLDLTSEFCEAAPFRAIACKNLPILDLTAPTPEQLRAAVDFITEASAGGVVYVHCKIGYSRSAAAVVAPTCLRPGWPIPWKKLWRSSANARPSIVIRPEVQAALETFAATNGLVAAAA